jgi:hypothetical protein
VYKAVPSRDRAVTKTVIFEIVDNVVAIEKTTPIMRVAMK